MESERIVLYEELEGGVARITLNRPESGNAQNVELTYALNDAFMRAAHAKAVKCIVLRGAGRHFSTGHDLKDVTHDDVGDAYPLTSSFGDVQTTDVEGWFGWEREVYLDMCRRWRNLPKPTIAQVHGGCIGGGLMLAWVCDLIVAAEGAFFQDPVVNIGVLGVEYFAHAWELGPRKAKELLFTADRWSAEEALGLGMVNQVVPAAELDGYCLALASRIAAKPSFALKLAKEAVNGSVDAQGQQQAINLAFAYHQLNHADNRLRFGGLLNPNGMPEAMRRQANLSPLVVGRPAPADRNGG